MNSIMAQVSGQLSMFFVGPDAKTVAVCCEDGRELPAQRPEKWMLALIPGGELVVYIGKHPLVLRPVPTRSEDIPAGNRYYHYRIDRQVYSGIFVGTSDQCNELSAEEQEYE